MKLYLIKIPFGIDSNRLFTINKWYEGDLIPSSFPSVSVFKNLGPRPPSYIIKCDDGNYRNIVGNCFLTLEEFREKQLNEIGI
jgi:hypothetical protein